MKKLIGFLIIFLLLQSITSQAKVEGVDLNLTNDEIAFTFLDLNNGEATLIQSSEQQNILINTGGPKTEEQLKERLETFGVLKLDKLVITNLEENYTENVKWLLESYVVDEVILSKDAKPEFIKRYGQYQKKIRTLVTSESIELLPNLSMSVFAADESLIAMGDLSFKMSFRHHRIIYMSTANKQLEEQLTSEQLLKAEILKVAEFAKAEGTTQTFLEKVDPQIAVIFRLQDQSPSPDVIERLGETWIDIYQTKQFGNITIKCNKEDYEVLTIPTKKKG